jgi:thiol-disulfide isomerase/thioredoxin
MEPNISADTISDISLPNLSISSSEFNESAPLNDTTDIVRFYSKHNTTLSALKDAFMLAGKKKSTYFIKKDIERHVGYNYFFHIWCDRCKTYKAFSRKTKKMTCSDCFKEMKLKETNYFVFIPLKQQLIKILDKYNDEILKYRNEKSANNMHSNISDIYDGSIFQNILRELPDKFPLSLVLNIDGVKIFNFGAGVFKFSSTKITIFN